MGGGVVGEGGMCEEVRRDFGVGQGRQRWFLGCVGAGGVVWEEYVRVEDQKGACAEIYAFGIYAAIDGSIICCGSPLFANVCVAP